MAPGEQWPRSRLRRHRWDAGSPLSVRGRTPMSLPSRSLTSWRIAWAVLAGRRFSAEVTPAAA
jgi:hypothetical protein